MPLPVRLSPGIVSIYGYPSLNNLKSYNPNIIFGVVDAVYLDVPGIVSVGQVIMVDKTKVESVTYENTEYFLVPEELIKLVENSVVAP